MPYECRSDTAAEAGKNLVRLIQGLPNDGTIGQLKDKVATRMPAEARDLINAWVAEHEGQGFVPAMQLTIVDPKKPLPDANLGNAGTGHSA